MTVANEFGRWLRQQMVTYPMSQADLARRAGVSAGMLSGWINGRRVPSPESCDRLADALGLDLDDMLSRAGHRPRLPIDGTPEAREVLTLMDQLSKSQRQEVVEYARWRRDIALRRAEGG